MEEEVKLQQTTGAGTQEIPEIAVENTQEIPETVGADTPKTAKKPKKRKAGAVAKKTAKRVAAMGIFTALAYAVSFLETPALFGTNFLKLDVSNVFILLIAFLLGPVEGVIVCFLKECLCLINTQTSGVGQIANFLVTSSYLLIPAILYRCKRKFKMVLIGLTAACLFAPAVALLANRFIMLPFFAPFIGSDAKTLFATYWVAILGFNVMKGVIVALITLFLYKRLSYFFKKWKI